MKAFALPLLSIQQKVTLSPMRRDHGPQTDLVRQSHDKIRIFYVPITSELCFNLFQHFHIFPATNRFLTFLHTRKHGIGDFSYWHHLFRWRHSFKPPIKLSADECFPQRPELRTCCGERHCSDTGRKRSKDCCCERVPWQQWVGGCDEKFVIFSEFWNNQQRFSFWGRRFEVSLKRYRKDEWSYPILLGCWSALFKKKHETHSTFHFDALQHFLAKRFVLN